MVGQTAGERNGRSLLGGMQRGDTVLRDGINQLYSSGLVGPSPRYSRALFACVYDQSSAEECKFAGVWSGTAGASRCVPGSLWRLELRNASN